MGFVAKPISAERAPRSGHAVGRKLDGGRILGQIGPCDLWLSQPSRRGSESEDFVESLEMSLVSTDLINFGENCSSKVAF